MTAVEPADPPDLVGFTAPVVRPDPDTRLDQLAAEYATLKPLADEYAARLKTVVDGIKLELSTLHPSEREVLLVGAIGSTPLRMEVVVKWGLDTKALKTAHPEIYVRYAQQRTERRLLQVKG